MSYQIYTTDALVIKRIPYDANVSYLLFTRDFGLISALATGVRKSESKLRYALQEYSLCQISLVKGRHTWRLTSASVQQNLYLNAESLHAREVVARICNQILRLVVGQEKDEALFDTVSSGLTELVITSPHMVVAIEILLMLRMLHILGYVSEVDTTLCLSYTDYTDSILQTTLTSKSVFIEHINKGLKESQL